jgi:hypothetical protein
MLDHLKRFLNGAVHHHPPTIPGLVALDADAARLFVHVLPAQRAQLAEAHPGVERDRDHRPQPVGQGLHERGLLVSAQASISGVVLTIKLDRQHRIPVETAMPDRAVEDRLQGLRIVGDRGDRPAASERGKEVFDLPRRDVEGEAVMEPSP